MNAREDFLKQRQVGIGGSDIGAILGVSKYASPVDIWLRKTGRAQPYEQTPAMYWGVVLEDVVAQEFQRRKERKIQRVTTQLAHPERSWMIANIDRALVCPDMSGTVRWKDGRLTTRELLECKTSNAFAAKDWGDEDTDELPLTYNAQGQWYMGVTGAEVCHYAVLIGGSDYRTYQVERDDDLIKGMIEKAEEFWFKHVIADVAPEPQTADDAVALFPKDDGSEVEGNDEDHTNYLRLLGLKKDIAELSQVKDEVEAQLKIRMGSHASLAWNGSTLATWKAAKDSKKTNWELVAEQLAAQVGSDALAAAVAANTEIRQGSRRFNLK